jgi:hypothetical protein
MRDHPTLSEHGNPVVFARDVEEGLVRAMPIRPERRMGCANNEPDRFVFLDGTNEKPSGPGISNVIDQVPDQE